MFAEVKDMLPVSGDLYDAQIITQIKAAALDLTTSAEIVLPGVISIKRNWVEPVTGVLTPVKALEDVLNHNKGMAFLPTANASEDIAFCKRATGAGYQIWCEPTARVGHVGAVTIWPEDGKQIRGEIHGLEGKTLN